MNTNIQTTLKHQPTDNLIILSYKTDLDWTSAFLSQTEAGILHNSIDKGNQQITFLQENRFIIVEILSLKDNRHQTQELARRNAAKTIAVLRQYKITDATLVDNTKDNLVSFFTQGLVLANY